MKKVIYLFIAVALFAACKKETCYDCTRETIHHVHYTDHSNYSNPPADSNDTTYFSNKVCDDISAFQQPETIKYDTLILPNILDQPDDTVFILDKQKCNCIQE